MIALGAIVIIVVAVIVGVILATRGGVTGASIADASSLQFKADVTQGGNKTTYTYSAKNIGTSNAMLRIEQTGSQGSFIFIVNGAQKQAWAYENGAWNNFTYLYNTYWTEWNSGLTQYKNNLSHWSGSGDYTYTDPTTGYSIRVYSISVNPSLADSLFQPS